MARGSGRHSEIAIQTSSSPAPQNTRKRAQSSVEATTGSKRTKKQSNGDGPTATPTKSHYFDNGKGVRDQVADLSDSASEPSDAGDESEFEVATERDSPDAESEQEEEEEEEYISSEEEKPKRKRKSLPAKQSKATLPSRGKGSELWREGAATGLEPGTQIIIKKPKARAPGKTPYNDDTIHPNTMLFLEDLKANNDREWLKMHDPDYRASLNDWNSFVEGVTQKLTQIDETIPELPLKDIVFRIYRDIRFSPDPTPYKAYFSAAWSRTGRKGPYAAYYLQLMPGESFIGGGLWHPEAQALAALRRDIDRKPHRIKNMLTIDSMRKEFLNGVPENADKAVAAFVASRTNAGSALKTKPKGYDADHHDIGLLRLKNFTIGRKLSDEEILGPECMERVGELLQIMLPFITYLNSVVMPDEPNESDSHSESDE